MKAWLCKNQTTVCAEYTLCNTFIKGRKMYSCFEPKSVIILPLAEARLILAESKAGREYYKWRDHGELSPYKNKASGHFGETIGKLDAWRNQKGRVM